MNKNFADAKLLSDSIASSLDVLYTYSIMQSNNTLEDATTISRVIFTIQTAAEKLSEMVDELEGSQSHE